MADFGKFAFISNQLYAAEYGLLCVFPRSKYPVSRSWQGYVLSGEKGREGGPLEGGPLRVDPWRVDP